MPKLNSLILLIKSLSKSEKKMIHIRSKVTDTPKEYMTLFHLIDKQDKNDDRELTALLKEKYPKAFFPAIVSYLCDFILNVLVDLRQKQDDTSKLLNTIAMAHILNERNLRADYLELLQKLTTRTRETGNYHLLLLVQRMELNSLLRDEFKGFSEQDLLDKQYKIHETLTIIRQINEQSTLYELLTYYLHNRSHGQSLTTTPLLNDLLVSEISLVSNLKHEIFEISKLHQLFQAHYLISMGNYQAALNSFVELNKLFLDNKALWQNPPVYYVLVLEGILESLRGIRAFDRMPYFLDMLKQLEYSPVNFQADLLSIDFLYTLVPFLDMGDHKQAITVVEAYKTNLLLRKSLLNPYRNLQVSLHAAIVYLLNGHAADARKQLSPIIQTDSYMDIWLYRPIFLVNLMICYKMGEYGLLQSGIRSLRHYNKKAGQKSRIEYALCRFLNQDLHPLSTDKKDALRHQYEILLDTATFTDEDTRLLRVFNFPQWIISSI